VSDLVLANEFPQFTQNGKPDTDAIIKHIIESSEAQLTHVSLSGERVDAVTSLC
jgi:hypothetical protein